jgi:hypothetical protein
LSRSGRSSSGKRVTFNMMCNRRHSYEVAEEPYHSPYIWWCHYAPPNCLNLVAMYCKQLKVRFSRLPTVAWSSTNAFQDLQ